MSRSKPKRIEVREGSFTVPIYEFSDGRYCVDTVVAGKRRRVTRASLEAAKIEARKLINQIASGRSHESALTISEVEDYRLAKTKLASFNVSLIQVVEEWVAGRAKVDELKKKRLPEVVEEFLTSKEVGGVSSAHLEDRRHRLNRLAAVFPGRIDLITTHEIESWLNGLKVAGRTRNNYRNAALQLFRYARGKRYLPRHEPTVVEDVPAASAGEGEIQIYSPAELRLLLHHAPDKLLPFFAIGAFAGLRSEEIMRLDWKDIRFDLKHIEVSAAKAKTASRRLVPLLPVLEKWLGPLRKEEGHVVGYTRNDVLSQARTRFRTKGIVVDGRTIAFRWKPNALRHSYASYRLAAVKNAAQVALEMGNSPSMLFRNYRELVTEKEAEEWFATARPTIASA